MRHRDDYDLIVLYEDIKKDPKDICRKLLSVCEVAPEHRWEAMKALERDSQMGLFGKRGDKPRIGCNMLQPCDNMFKEMGLPIHSRTTDEEFKDIILTGTYKMCSKYDPPSEIYERVFAEVKHVSRLESLWLMKK